MRHRQHGRALVPFPITFGPSMVSTACVVLLRWRRACPGSGLLNVFIKDLDDGIEKVLIKFADDTKLGGTTSILEDGIRIQNDLDKLEKWTGKNRMKFNRDKCKAVRRAGEQSAVQTQAGQAAWGRAEHETTQAWGRHGAWAGRRHAVCSL